jgi:ribonuclease-3
MDDSTMTEPLFVLQEKLGYRFSNTRLLVNALTHSSYAYESKDKGAEDNERLEFLGDGILDFVIAEELFHRKTKKDEGYLSKTRALIVCEAMLAEVAEEMDVGSLLLLGRGENASGGRQKPSNLSSAMEAMFAAIYLDGGFEAAKKAILSILNEAIRRALAGTLVFDYKSRLLEWSQSDLAHTPISFVILDEDGPVHDRIYRAAVLQGTVVIGEGTGRSKKQAEQNAAKAALGEIYSED